MSPPIKNPIKLTIDDQEIVVEKGTLVIEAAKQVGIQIPHFCYHPKLKPDANCRMCLVQIEKMPKLQTSCSTQATEGMVVKINSPLVKEAQFGVMQFILANHPLDCPICDQGGECHLQDLAHVYSPTMSQFEEVKRIFVKEYFSPVIEKEMNRCIQCMRCVRYCDEVMDVRALGGIGRGDMTEIGVFPAKTLDCEFCGGCVQICPVGAFTNRLPLYEFRPWQLHKTDTICNYCGDGCLITLETSGQKVVKVSSKAGVGRNEGDLCAKGFFGYEFVNHPGRLKKPLMRKEGKLTEVIWEEAIETVAEQLSQIKSQHGPNAIGGLITARCTNEELFLFQKFMRLAIGTNNVDSSVRYGHVNAAGAMKRILGTNRWTCSYEDIVRAEAILLIGTDITEANPVVGLKVKEAVRHRGSKLIAIEPYQRNVAPISNIVNIATHPLQLAAGSEWWAVTGMVKALIENHLVDEAIKAANPGYLAKLTQAVGRTSWNQIKDATGLSTDAFKSAANTLAQATRGVILFGLGVTRAARGFETVTNLLDLAILTGKVNREGCGVAPLTEENNEQGAVEMGAVPGWLPGLREVASPEARSQVSAIWREEIPQEAGANFLEMIERARRGEIKALYLVGENPVGTLPESMKVREALENLELLICQDLFLTQTGEMASVVLPAASYAEKEGTFTNHEGRVQRVHQAFGPIDGSRSDGEIFMDLSRLIGYPLDYDSPKAVFREIQRLIRGYQDTVWTTERRQEVAATLNLYLTQGFERDLSERYSAPKPEADGYPYTLILGPMLFHSGKLSLKSEGLLMLAKEGRLQINKKDAEQLGVKDGDPVRIASGQGRAEVKVKINSKLPDGLLFFPEHFNQPPIKDLMPVSMNSQSQVPSYRTASVKIESV
jgi:formate dehydrogenase (NADP+) alpha subunit